jgi:hypothetical protein
MAQSAVTRATPYAQRGVAQARAAGASGRRRLTDMINDPLGVGKIDLSNLGY